MKDNKRSHEEKPKRKALFFQNKQAIRGARITYQVIWNVSLLFIILIILGGAFAGGVGAGYFASLVKDEPIRSYDSMKKDIYNYEETSELYFANDVYLGKLRTDLEREEVKLDDVSVYLKNAVIATEDKYFYEHDGVVPKAVLRALFQDVMNTNIQTGGSTLTQQLIKNQILTNETSYVRKAKEILLALRLEKFFEKDEILEAYLNVATFGRNSSGRNIAGVQSAAKGLFGTSASDLNLPQAAFIAGLPQSPFGYTPFTREATLKNNLEPGLTRMKTVLARMYENNFITEQQYNDALKYDIVKDFIAPKKSTIEKYPWLTTEIETRAIDILATILAEKDGYEDDDLKNDKALYNEYLALADKNLRQNGYKIYSTINKDIYDKMQQVKNEYPYYGTDRDEEITDPDTGEKITVTEPVELGALLMDNKTGRIISFVGGRDHSREATNHATNAERPNGSTMKPLLVYAPAIELGKISPGTIIPDVEVHLNPASSNPWPQNYDKRYSGITSARYALTRSYNVPAVLTYKSIISERPAQYLDKMGFTSLVDDDYTNLSTALGSLSRGVTVEENVNAYATFGNNGKFVDAYLIEKIVDSEGNSIYEHKSEEVDVFSPQTAYLTVDMMRDVVNRGTAASLSGRLKFSADWAGKTGTGQDYKDAWFVATNPNVTFGVWIGYDTPKMLDVRYKGLSYGVRNIYLWADLMNAAYEVEPELVAPKERFKMPGGIVRRSYCTVSGLLPSEECLSAGLVETDLFNAKYVPSISDDSLLSGKYVTIDDKRYLALESTPEEFVSVGTIINPEYFEKTFGIKIEDPSQLIPKKDRWANILVPDNKIEDNGKVPATVTVKQSGNTITWSKHSENDVIGYRVYKKLNETSVQKVASIIAGNTLSFKGEDGEYYVIAVDITGKESTPSTLIRIGDIPPKKPDPNTDPEDDSSGDDGSTDGNTDNPSDNDGGDDTSIPGVPNPDNGQTTPENPSPSDGTTKPKKP